MTEKQKRHRKILELVVSHAIGSQETLTRALKEIGISTTQSTLSKDIKELGVVKAPDGDGFRYHVPGEGGRVFPHGGSLLRRELTDFVVDVDGAENMLVLKTITGHAQGVCEAIDQANWPEVVGTIAGENTIFVLCRSATEREGLRNRILEITGAL